MKNYAPVSGARRNFLRVGAQSSVPPGFGKRRGTTGGLVTKPSAAGG